MKKMSFSKVMSMIAMFSLTSALSHVAVMTRMMLLTTIQQLSPNRLTSALTKITHT